MSLFKRKTKAPELPKVIGIYTAQTKTVSVMDHLETEVKYPNVLEILSYHQSVYIIDDSDSEYFKVVLRYQPNKIGYVKKSHGSYIMYTALPYSVLVHEEGEIAVYDKPTIEGNKVGMCNPNDRLLIETEWDNFGKIYDKPCWVNLDEVNKLRC